MPIITNIKIYVNQFIVYIILLQIYTIFMKKQIFFNKKIIPTKKMVGIIINNMLGYMYPYF